jgi:hypothetical protein
LGTSPESGISQSDFYILKIIKKDEEGSLQFYREPSRIPMIIAGKDCKLRQFNQAVFKET